MKTTMRKIKNLTLAAGATLLVSGPLLAEDIEIYTGTGSNVSSTIYPNIVFIIDTSGSMDTDVTLETITGTYDSATDYPGDCDSDDIYWSSDGTTPDCDSDNYFIASSNKCDVIADTLADEGIARSFKAARYRSNRRGGDTWSDLSDRNHDDYVECQADWGVHGQSSATNPYPADENDGGPWTSVEGNGIDWDDFDDYNFYSGNYLNFLSDPDNFSVTVKSRIQIVKEVFSDLIDTLSDNFNIAVMRFSTNAEGGYFVMPMQQLDHDAATGNADDYKAAVNAMSANGYTPLAETMYEAYLYYKGAAVDFGDSSTPGTNHADVFTGANYDSPINNQCQKNYVILLTDGEPTADTSADTKIQNMTGFSAVTGSATCSGNCLDELAKYMYNRDCRSDLNGDQVVSTYTIGFHTDQTLLLNTAINGGTHDEEANRQGYFTATSDVDLSNAFSQIINDISDKNTSFTSPAVSVNAFNRFTHRDELYYAVFQPNKQPYWHGNIKRYQLRTDDDGAAFIADADGSPAVDTETGYFAEDSTSFWTDTGADGHEVIKGGAAHELALTRTVYTYTGSDVPSNEVLSDAANELHEDNTAITGEMLGDAAMDTATRTAILQWARGVDIFDEDEDGLEDDIRTAIGDPLHSKPKLITYGGTAEEPDITLFVGTNEGYLMAIDTDDGTEIFSFMPQELLENLPTLYANNDASSHPYGLDGPLTAWINDKNGNGVIYDTDGDLETDEFVYLYIGMRMGGDKYYSLDVTDRAHPKLRWMIDGGTGDYAELGQTWSSPSGGKIKVGNSEKMVLIVGGGYDLNQEKYYDDATYDADGDNIGRAVYIIDADTGDRIWWAGGASSDANVELSAMTHSIPSEVKAIDTNFDGYLDRLYVGDMKGQLWRFDIHNGEDVADLVTGGVIAELGGTGEANNRRFFYAPDVSLSENSQFLNIAIGSGWRSHPLDDGVHDAFFIVRDENVWAKPDEYTSVALADLYDATDNVIGEGDAEDKAAAQAVLDGSGGLYIWLNDIGTGAFVGEKVLAESITYDGVTYFTTYTPPSEDEMDEETCSAEGSGKLFIISVADGTPVDFGSESDGGSDLAREDRNVYLNRAGIAPDPSLIFHEDGTVLAVGTEIQDAVELSRAPRKIYWSVQ